MILDALWEALYPALKEGEWVPDESAYELLQQKLSRLSLILPAGNAASPKGAEVTGKKFRLMPNKLGYDACEFDFSGGRSARLNFFRGGERSDLRFGMNEWIVAEDPFMGIRAANAGTWVDEKTCIVRIQHFHPLQMFMLTCRFAEDNLLVIQVVPVGEHRKDVACYLNGSC